MTHGDGQSTPVEPGRRRGDGRACPDGSRHGAAVLEVVDATWTGFQHRRLGTAQAWAYPADRLLVVWECVLDDWVRRDSSLMDPVLTTVWTGFERVLTRWFPQAERIATPSWVNLYEHPVWHQFLAG